MRGYICCDTGSSALQYCNAHVNQNFKRTKPTRFFKKTGICEPVVVIKCAQLRDVSFKRRDIFDTKAPERANLQNIP